MWQSSFQLYCTVSSLIQLACAGQLSDWHSAEPSAEPHAEISAKPLVQSSGQPCSLLCDLPESVAECEDTLLEEQRQATAIWAQAYADKDVDTMMSYVVDDYIQHNPNIHSGRDIAQKYISKRLSSPGLVNNVTRVVSQLNFVMLHVHRTEPGKKDRAMADIYRLDGTCIVEHWDVQQEMDPGATNPAAFF